MENIIKQVIEFAEKCHGDQKYGTLPYSYHFLGVYNLVDTVIDTFDLDVTFFTRVDCRIAALLHDILEDCEDVDILSITTFLDSIDSDNILNKSAIISALIVLTHEKNQSYTNYITYISNTINRHVVEVCTIAHVVKLADLKFNIRESNSSLTPSKFTRTRIEKYELAEQLLTASLKRVYE
jgi:(p)ppGpp synthase/HD superfamily hydrolase